MDEDRPMSFGEKVAVGVFSAAYAGICYWMYRDGKRYDQEREHRKELERQANQAIAVISASAEMLAYDVALKNIEPLDPSRVAELDQVRTRLRDAVETLEGVRPEVEGYLTFNIEKWLIIADRLDQALR